MSESESNATRVTRSAKRLASKAADKVVDATNAAVQFITTYPEKLSHDIGAVVIDPDAPLCSSAKEKEPMMQFNTAPIQKLRDDANDIMGNGMEKMRKSADDSVENAVIAAENAASAP